MIKLRKKLLIALLTAAIALSVGQTMVWSDAENDAADDSSTTSDEAAENSDDSEDSDSSEEEEVTLLTDDDALAMMQLYAENDTMQLYVNEETCEFGVKVKESGYVWWSSPINAANDPIAKGAQVKTMRSLFYYNSGDPVVHRSSKTTAFEGSINRDDFTIEKIDGGVKFILHFEKTSMTIPLYVRIGEDSFEATIPTSEIIEETANTNSEGGAALLNLSFLASLGAGTSDENGYLFVPDGSGAIINFNNNKTSTSAYSSQVYGRDLGVGQKMAPDKTEQVYLPVLGIVKNIEDAADNALVAVVTSGDSYATVNASVNGQTTTSYNSAWFDFTLRTEDTFFMGSGNKELVVYEAGDIKIGDISVRYYPIIKDTISYADLAETYRNYLISDKGLTVKTKENDAPFYLTLDGGTIKTQSVAGFPVDLETPATTYEQAAEIVKLLEEQGVDTMTVTYNDFNAAGITSRISANVDYSGTLGGKDKFTDFYEYLKSKNYSLYPSVDIMEYQNSGNGYSFTLNACKQITKAYATQQAYELAFGIPHQLRTAWTILSPYYWTDLFGKLAASFKEEGITTISLNQATSVLYSDFSRHNINGRDYLLRGDAQEMLEIGYKQLDESGITLLAQACNEYALPYADFITDVPLYSSNYDVFDYDVPFYEMVIHGYIPYTTKAMNASSNAVELLLLAAVSGTPIHYEMMYEDPNEFTDCEYEYKFYTNYSGWIEQSASEYKMFKEIVAPLSTSTITSYEYLTPTVVESTFSNGTTITVDLDAETINVNGNDINLADYGLKGDIE